MPKHLFLRRLLPLLGAVALAGSAQAQQKTVRLTGTISPKLAEAHQVGRLAQDELVRFTITFPVRKQAELDEFLRRLYTPGDPLYHQFLGTGHFSEAFGPTQAQYDAVAAFAKRSGLTVSARYSNRMILDVAGPAAAVEKALGVHMLRFQSPSGRVFHAPDQEPSLPEEVAPLVSGIANLDKSLEPQPDAVRRVTQPTPAAGSQPSAYPSGPSGGIAPADIKTAYNLNGLTQNGTGQTVALVELDGFYQSDINAYADKFGLPRGTINIITVPDGASYSFPTAPTTTQPDPGGPQECTLDIEMVKALAPNATINVYEGVDQLTILNKIASDNTAQQVSTSWRTGLETSVTQTYRNSENTAFQQMATQGQSAYGSSGDFGDNVRTGTDSSGKPILTFGVADPASQPFHTTVGGTSLTFNATTGAYQSETAWTGDTAPNGGSGGGISNVWPLPDYQSSLPPTGSLGSSDYRNLPDVALEADATIPTYDIYESYGYPTLSGQWRQFGGTSAAAPLWAAFTALVNQQRHTTSTSNLGFANPTIYFLGYARPNDFHDMTVGNNGHYPAVAGYDNVTGWGSFNGGVLFNDLVQDATVLHVDANYTGTVIDGSRAKPFIINYF